MPPQGFNLPAFNPTSGFIPPPIPQPTSPSFSNYLSTHRTANPQANNLYNGNTKPLNSVLPPQLVELIKLMYGYVS